MTERIVVLFGGGVGGTLVANLLVRKLKSRVTAAVRRLSRSLTRTGAHVYQPGFMYLATDGGDPVESSSAASGRCSIARSGLFFSRARAS